MCICTNSGQTQTVIKCAQHFLLISNTKIHLNLRSEVLTAVNMKVTVLKHTMNMKVMVLQHKMNMKVTVLQHTMNMTVTVLQHTMNMKVTVLQHTMNVKVTVLQHTMPLTSEECAAFIFQITSKMKI